MIRRSVFVYISVIVLLFSGIIIPELLGASRSDYSSVANYLSELGATDTPTQYLTNALAFPLVGLSCIALIVAFWHRFPASKAIRAGLICLLVAIPAGYFGAVLFPCDYGCPLAGSASQTAHNLLGLVQYPLGVIGFGLLSVNLKGKPNWRLAFGIAAAAMVIGFAMMISPSQFPLRGAWQRLSDYTAFLIIGYVALSTQPRKTAQ